MVEEIITALSRIRWLLCEGEHVVVDVVEGRKGPVAARVRLV